MDLQLPREPPAWVRRRIVEHNVGAAGRRAAHGPVTAADYALWGEEEDANAMNRRPETVPNRTEQRKDRTMFNDPASSSAFLEPGKYRGKLVELEQTAPSIQHPEWGAGIKWIFELAEPAGPGKWARVWKKDSTGQPTDEPYPYWQFSSPKLTPGSKARPWVEALLGRPLVEGQDKGADLATQLLGKEAVLMIGPQAQKDGTIKQDCILSMSPYQTPAANGKATAAVSANIAALEDDLPEAQRTGAVAVTEPEDDFAF